MSKITWSDKTTGDQYTAAEATEVKTSANILYDRSVNVEDFGAVGDGVTDDSAAIQLAIDDIGTDGGVVYFSRKTYLVNNQTGVSKTNIALIGYGAVIKRAASVKTQLAAEAASGVTSIDVDSVVGFAVGDTFIITDGTDTFSGRGREENSAGTANTIPHTITDITSNTITFTQGVTLTTNLGANPFPIGSNVVRVFNMFGAGGTTAAVAGFGQKWEGIEFDGNRANNAWTHSWVFNRCLSQFNRRSIVENCTFHDMPCENMIGIGNDCLVTGCRGYDLNGSFIHISNGTADGRIMITDCHLEDICEITFDENGHNEGAITYSANPLKTYVSDLSVENCGNNFIGDLADYTIIDDCKIINCDGFSTSNHQTGTIDHLSITSCHIEDCDNIELDYKSPNQIYLGGGYDNVIIVNNKFINTRIYARSCSNMNINDNTFIAEEGYTFASIVASALGMINMMNCVNVNVQGNSLENRQATQTAELLAGIICNFETTPTSQLIKSDASTDTEYFYGARNMSIDNNIIIGFGKGIGDWFVWDYLGRAPELHVRSASFFGLSFTNNTIQLRSDADADWGIFCGPGTYVSNNKVYGDSNANYGIFALGANDGSGTTYTGTARNTLNGAIVHANHVVGIDMSIKVGHPVNASFGANSYNCQVIGNFADGTIQDDSVGNSTISGTIALINETAPIYLARENTGFY